MSQSAQGWCTEMTLKDGMGRGVGGGFRMGNTCTPMADSCQCMAKTTTILEKKKKAMGKTKKEIIKTEKKRNDLCSFPRQTIQYHSNPSLCPDQ